LTNIAGTTEVAAVGFRPRGPGLLTYDVTSYGKRYFLTVPEVKFYYDTTLSEYVVGVELNSAQRRSLREENINRLLLHQPDGAEVRKNIR
jgi:hypothetical protein